VTARLGWRITTFQASKASTSIISNGPWRGSARNWSRSRTELCGKQLGLSPLPFDHKRHKGDVILYYDLLHERVAALTGTENVFYPNSEILTHGAQRCAGMIAL
jgi:hypothetical protein